MTVRVLVILNYYYPYVSGLSEYARLLCEGLKKRGYEVTVLTSNHNDLKDKEVINGINVVRAPIWFKISKGTISPKFIIWAIKFARKYDIVHMHLPMLEAGLISCFIPNKKLICTYHCDINLPYSFVNNIILKIMDLSHKIALSKARYVVGNTIEYMETSRVVYKYKEKMKEIAPPIKDLKRVERKQHNGFVIGFCGRIVEEKGIDVLIKSFELLQQEYNNVELIIGGDYKAIAGGSIYSSLVEYIHQHNIKNIRFIGKVPEERMAEFYSSLDLFILPSINSLESFGMVQVEAMLCGTPVIASDLPGVRTIVNKTGMGLICKRGDVEDLKKCIVQVINNYSKYVMERSEIEKHYGIEITINSYLELIENITGIKY